nr:metalloregulator ArsR/SmtB family transcription factor [uncultured Chitinophaga sp.]
MKTTARKFKDTVYVELAKTAKALGNPHRMEIIDLLAQGPFTVETIARYTGMTIANTSQHLQVLKNAQLVAISRKGNYIYYQLTSENVYAAWASLRELGMTHNAEVKKAIDDYRKGYHNGDAVSAEELLEKVHAGDVIVLDVRPEDEYHRGHIHRAISIPLDQLQARIRELSKKQEIVAYCRGSLCMLVEEAVTLLKQQGYKARKFDDGYKDWALRGYPTAMTM